MKVLVTGAEGMLGSNVCRELINQGYSVRAIVLDIHKIQTISDLPLEILECNILDKDRLYEVMQGCECIINIAALTNVWPSKSQKVIDVNFVGVKHIIEVATHYQYQRIIQIGSASSFEFGSFENPGTEEKINWVNHFGLDYIKSKFLAQEFLINEFKLNQLPVIVINPTFMIGPFDSGPTSGKMLLELMKNKLPAYTVGGKNFVGTKDVAVAVVNALKMGRLGECYIAGNENLTYKAFFQKACSVNAMKFNLKKAPAFLLLGIGASQSILSKIKNSPPQLSYTMAKFACMNQYYSAEKARKELLMPQNPIEEAILESLVWYQSNGYLK